MIAVPQGVLAMDELRRRMEITRRLRDLHERLQQWTAQQPVSVRLRVRERVMELRSATPEDTLQFLAELERNA
ncbi:MAG: hypothetical protein R3C49_05680 [Planctomycetaceae bacterium]